jgi:hypothetical protein
MNTAEQKNIEYKLKEYNALKNLYSSYLHKTCSEWTHIESRFSAFDAILVSANTRCYIEHKNRNQSTMGYDAAMIEKKKFFQLLKLFQDTSSPILYVNQWNDGYVFIWDIRRYFNSNDLEEDVMYCPSTSYENVTGEHKPVFMIPFANSDFILRTSNYARLSITEFIMERDKLRKDADDFIIDLFSRE